MNLTKVILQHQMIISVNNYVSPKSNVEMETTFDTCYKSGLNGILLQAYEEIVGRSCIFYSNDSFNEWKEKKYLYYYYKVYDYIIKNSFSKKEEERCSKFLENIKNSCEKHTKSCYKYFFQKGNYMNEYPKYFICEKKYTPNHLLPKLKYTYN
ncbi:PIR protein [Plasmodium brasilianum]|uniref:PIR protein n=1 Tax=Plasmodium brasilianum TaxID=5824 RepID=A0ACB9Y280_PLABR|nr:PIR protein [Plasmodium brasilianum]